LRQSHQETYSTALSVTAKKNKKGIVLRDLCLVYIVSMIHNVLLFVKRFQDESDIFLQISFMPGIKIPCLQREQGIAKIP